MASPTDACRAPVLRAWCFRYDWATVNNAKPDPSLRWIDPALSLRCLDQHLRGEGAIAGIDIAQVLTELLWFVELTRASNPHYSRGPGAEKL